MRALCFDEEAAEGVSASCLTCVHAVSVRIVSKSLMGIVTVITNRNHSLMEIKKKVCCSRYRDCNNAYFILEICQSNSIISFYWYLKHILKLNFFSSNK